MSSSRPVEILTFDELTELAIDMQYASVAVLENTWYEKAEVFKEIDNRVMHGKVTHD
jgi:hypothetical protein